MPVLLHALGAERFGVWGAAASLAWMVFLTDLGTGSALVTLVARAIALDHLDEARRQIAGALTLGISLGLFSLVLIAAAWGWQKSDCRNCVPDRLRRAGGESAVELSQQHLDGAAGGIFLQLLGTDADRCDDRRADCRHVLYTGCAGICGTGVWRTGGFEPRQPDSPISASS